jgi:hypothetical protein
VLFEDEVCLCEDLRVIGRLIECHDCGTVFGTGGDQASRRDWKATQR